MPEEHQDEIHVWIWLPDHADPVVAGRLLQSHDGISFAYHEGYLAREDAIPLFSPELPLQRDVIEPLPGLSLPSCIRDASPDAWGRKAISCHQDWLASEAHEFQFLLMSGSDRIGALDFQASPSEYVPRTAEEATWEELIEAAERIREGSPLPPDLATAIRYRTAIGGARPKALIDDEGRKRIAKFSSSKDAFNVVGSEYAAMRLAALTGLNVADVELRSVGGKEVLLVDRFDRTKTEDGWIRHGMVSGLTILGLDEMMARYASYQDLAARIEQSFSKPQETLQELFGRLCFNVLSGNTDDHARNHAAFWEGYTLELTPAYDICPQLRTGNEASQAMLIKDNERMCTLGTCLSAAHIFGLQEDEAAQLIEGQILSIAENWSGITDEARLSTADKQMLSERQFLNPFCIEGTSNRCVVNAFEEVRSLILNEQTASLKP